MGTRWSSLSALVVLVWLVVACAPAAPPAAPPAATPAPQKITLTYWTHEYEPRNALDERYIAEFMEANPDIEVRYETFPFEDYETKLLTALAGGTGPDLFNISTSRMIALVRSGAVVPVDAQAMGYDSIAALQAEYIEGALDGFTFGGTLYAIPTEINNQALYVNVDHFREAGLDPETDYPKTWEEMVEVARKLTVREGDKIVRRGYDFTYGGDIDLPVLAFEGMAYQLGGTFLNEDATEATINSEPNVRALQFWYDWVHTYGLGDPSLEEPVELFGEGELSMVSVGTWFGPWLERNYPEVAESYIVVPFPRFQDAVNDTGAFLYAYGHMVNAASSPEEQAAAWKLIAFLDSKPVEYFREAGLMQPRKELETSGVLDEVPFARVFWNDMKGTPPDKLTGEMWEVVMRAIQRVTQDTVDPQTSLDQAKRELDEILARQ